MLRSAPSSRRIRTRRARSRSPRPRPRARARGRARSAGAAARAAAATVGRGHGAAVGDRPARARAASAGASGSGPASASISRDALELRFELVAHCVRSRCSARRASPLRVRVLTVPSGRPRSFRDLTLREAVAVGKPQHRALALGQRLERDPQAEGLVGRDCELLGRAAVVDRVDLGRRRAQRAAPVRRRARRCARRARSRRRPRRGSRRTRRHAARSPRTPPARRPPRPACSRSTRRQAP